MEAGALSHHSLIQENLLATSSNPGKSRWGRKAQRRKEAGSQAEWLPGLQGSPQSCASSSQGSVTPCTLGIPPVSKKKKKKKRPNWSSPGAPDAGKGGERSEAAIPLTLRGPLSPFLVPHSAERKSAITPVPSEAGVPTVCLIPRPPTRVILLQTCLFPLDLWT